MGSASGEPNFQSLDCQTPVSEYCQRPFSPSAVDIFDLGHDGGLRIAKNPCAGEATQLLDRSNKKLTGSRDSGTHYISPLIVIRFDVDEPAPAQEIRSQAALPPSNDDWSQFWPFFDPCNQEDIAVDFVARLCEADAHCHSNYSQNCIPNSNCVVECSRVSYSLHFIGKNFLIVHHSHQMGNNIEEMVRMATCGISQEYLEKMLRRALLFVGANPPETNGESAGGFAVPQLIPHPLAILCAMLECLEKWCGDELGKIRTRILEHEAYIKLQRDPDPATSDEKGLEIGSLRLNDTGIQLGMVRQKLQYLLSSIASLERMLKSPDSCKRSAVRIHEQLNGSGTPDAPEGRRSEKWWYQLKQVKCRLIELRAKSEQHNINVENQQERIRGNFACVSILLAERENEWSHKAMEKQHVTSAYQVEMMRFQGRMLAAQELIASRTQRDNTVMKVIAVLSSLFLPGAFIATLFSVPIFNWSEEDPRGPHFMTYWYVTGPVTGTLVIGFLVWFVKMWFDDRREVKEARDEAEKMAKMDPEKAIGARRSQSSLESRHLTVSSRQVV